MVTVCKLWWRSHCEDTQSQQMCAVVDLVTTSIHPSVSAKYLSCKWITFLYLVLASSFVFKPMAVVLIWVSDPLKYDGSYRLFSQNVYICTYSQNLAHAFRDSDLHLCVSDWEPLPLLSSWPNLPNFVSFSSSVFIRCCLGHFIIYCPLPKEDLKNKEIKPRLLNFYFNSFCK